MVMTYKNIQDRVEQILQDATAATYTTTMTDMWIEEALKEFSQYDPHIVPVVFHIESRFGSDTAGTEGKLTDTTKTQFTTTDDSDEKVIHNTTDNTWATATTATASTTTVITLNADIMDSGESYEIYNKRCWNNRQIYLGNPTDIRHDSYLWIDSVEYPIGTKRSWRVYGDVLEIDVYNVGDSNSLLDPLNAVDVLVRFAKPHRLCQMTDLQGAVQAAGSAGGVAIVAYNFTLTQAAEAGDEFHIENHRTLYTCTEAITWSDAVNGNVLYFFPPLEADAPKDDVIFFTMSTLQPQHEALFCRMVAARAILSDVTARINTINKGGATVYQKMLNWADNEMIKIERAFQRNSVPITKRTLPRD